jgi:hypothetical protein
MVPGESVSMLSSYFFAAANTEPELLQLAGGEDNKEEAVRESAILEQDGIHIINSNLFNPDSETEAGLDKDFRELVDSIISRSF